MVPEQSTSPRTAAAEVEELLNEQQRDEDEIDRSRYVPASSLCS